MPEGVGDEHIIRQGQALDYKILFQNTGTFAADKVVIRDTLPFFMDPATFSMGVSSHPCQFDLSGAGILTFTFDNIALPDSNTNEQASHGFVQFHVAPKTWLTDGMVIENRAGIYFDFNEPVITNTVARKIGQLDHVAVSGTNIASGSDGLDMSPNPAIDLVNIYLPPAMGTSGEASLHDSFGKVVQVYSFSGNMLTINRQGVASGVYYLTLKCDNGKVMVGKVVWR
jgi:uncharacterized repeat protein (TIGR01451 family)